MSYREETPESGELFEEPLTEEDLTEAERRLLGVVTLDDIRTRRRKAEMEEPASSPMQAEIARIQRELDANRRFLETGRYTDYLLAREEDKHSTKSVFIRGFQQGCPLGVVSVLILVGLVGGLLFR